MPPLQYAYEPEDGSLKGMRWTFEPEAQPEISHSRDASPQGSRSAEGRRSFGWLAGMFHSDPERRPIAAQDYSRSSSHDTPPPPPPDQSRHRSREDPAERAQSASLVRSAPSRPSSGSPSRPEIHGRQNLLPPAGRSESAAASPALRIDSRASCGGIPSAAGGSVLPSPRDRTSPRDEAGELLRRGASPDPPAPNHLHTQAMPESPATLAASERLDHNWLASGFQGDESARNRTWGEDSEGAQSPRRREDSDCDTLRGAGSPVDGGQWAGRAGSSADQIPPSPVGAFGGTGRDAGAGVGALEAPYPLDQSDVEVAPERHAIPASPEGGSIPDGDLERADVHSPLATEELPRLEEASIESDPPPRRRRCCLGSCCCGASRRLCRRSSEASSPTSRSSYRTAETSDCWMDCCVCLCDMICRGWSWINEFDLSLVAKTGAQKYATRGPARCPCCCCWIYLLLVIAVVGVGNVLMPIQVETDFDSFQKTDVEASLLRDTFIYALKERTVDEGRRLQEWPELAQRFEDWRFLESAASSGERGLLVTRRPHAGPQGRELSFAGAELYKHFDLEIVYDFPDGNLFDVEILQSIASFEQELRSMPLWAKMCTEGVPEEQSFCALGISFANYALPSLAGASSASIVPEALTFDGKGDDIIPSRTIFQLLEEHSFVPVVLPIGYDTRAVTSLGAPPPVTSLRSAFRWKFYCCDSWDSQAYQREVVGGLKENWKEFITNEFLPAIEEKARFLGPDGDRSIKVYYDGDDILATEVMTTLINDLKLAVGSMSFVLLYMWFHIGSFLLSSMSLLIIIFSIPLSYVLFAAITSQYTMNLASFLSVFLVVGLGSDVVFVYSDFWKDSVRHQVSHSEDPSALSREAAASRMAWTYYHAGKASLATTATTAISFFANLASVLKPLREFGFFMGLNVMLVWLLLSLIFVPLCYIKETWFSAQAKDKWAGKPVRMVLNLTAGPRECCSEFWYNFRILCLPDCTGILDKEAWTLRLHRWRRCVVATSIVLTAACLIWAGAQVEVDTGVPNIFPADHNQNRGQRVLGSQFTSLGDVFDPMAYPEPTSAKVCREYGNWDIADRVDCSLFWCEVPASATLMEENACSCWRSYDDAQDCLGQTEVDVKQRFMAADRLSAQDVEHAAENLRQFGQSTHGLTQYSSPETYFLNPLVLQEWESGDVTIAPITQVETKMSRTSDSSSCGFNDICFCGTYSCTLPEDEGGGSWSRVDDVQVKERRLNSFQPPPRVLSQWSVPSSQRANVEVIFGLKVTVNAPMLGPVDMDNLWAFDSDHQIFQPWAQRNLYALCQEIPEQLRVTDKRCWIEQWRTFLIDKRNARFPATPTMFDAWIMDFAQGELVGLSIAQDYLWIRNNTVKASFLSFTIDVHEYASTQVAMTQNEKWNMYLQEYNADASRFANKAFHCASLWVRAEAQDALIMSTALTLALVILLAMGGMLIFTKDWCLSLLVVIATVMVVCGLAFWMIVVFGWLIGPIEVIALIVFIGYAVTYSLHIAHRYGCSDAEDEPPPPDQEGNTAVRFQRTHYALSSIGSAAAGSAATTAGASMFLIFCTLTIFKKLGAVVLCVTVMSIFMALGPLCAALFTCGPVNPGRRCLPNCRHAWAACKKCFARIVTGYREGSSTEWGAKFKRGFSGEGFISKRALSFEGFRKRRADPESDVREVRLSGIDCAIDSPRLDAESEARLGSKDAIAGDFDEPIQSTTSGVVAKWFHRGGAPAQGDKAEAEASRPQEPVRLTMKLRKLDYHKLHADPDLVDAFKEKIKQAVVREAANSVTPEHVEVRLSPGSVVVESIITPPEGAKTDNLVSKLRSSFTISDSVERQVRNLKGIQAASKGLVTVCDLSIAKIQAPPSMTPDAPVDASTPRLPHGGGLLTAPELQVMFPTDARHPESSSSKRPAPARVAPVPTPAQEFSSLTGPKVRELPAGANVPSSKEHAQVVTPSRVTRGGGPTAPPSSWEPAQAVSAGLRVRPATAGRQRAPPLLVSGGPPATAVGAPQLGLRGSIHTGEASEAELHQGSYVPRFSPQSAAIAPPRARVVTPAAGAAERQRGRERRKKLAEMDFDIGDETPIDRIWSREVESTGKNLIVDNRAISRELPR